MLENDIKYAKKILDNDFSNQNRYRRVRILPGKSLKTFKKLKLDNRNVLTKVNSIFECFDLASYNANLTSYSSNIFDKYFLELMCNMTMLGYEDYMKILFGNNKVLNKEVYGRIRESLSDDTKCFFDNLYLYIDYNNIFRTNLCYLGYKKSDNLDMFIRTFIKRRYYELSSILKEKNIDYLYANEATIPKRMNEDSLNVINLGFNIDNMNEEKRNFILSKINSDFKPLLKENGKILIFTSSKDIKIENIEKNSVRSIKDPFSLKSDCKKDYAYVLKK